jgi:hypothetical protein
VGRQLHSTCTAPTGGGLGGLGGGGCGGGGGGAITNTVTLTMVTLSGTTRAWGMHGLGKGGGRGVAVQVAFENPNSETRRSLKVPRVEKPPGAF